MLGLLWQARSVDKRDRRSSCGRGGLNKFVSLLVSYSDSRLYDSSCILLRILLLQMNPSQHTGKIRINMESNTLEELSGHSLN
jgi:hypothetical protein